MAARKAKRQATAEQRALAAKGIGKITRGGAYRSPARVQSDQMRNVRRTLQKQREALKVLAAGAPSGSSEQKRYQAREAYKAQQILASYSKGKKTGKTVSGAALRKGAQRLKRMQQAAKGPTTSKGFQNRERMANLDWGVFMSKVSRMGYSDVGVGMWAPGDLKGMSHEDRQQFTENALVEAVERKYPGFRAEYDDKGNLTDASKADLMDIVADLYESTTGGVWSLFDFAEDFADGGGSPKDVGVLAAFFA